MILTPDTPQVRYSYTKHNHDNGIDFQFFPIIGNVRLRNRQVCDSRPEEEIKFIPRASPTTGLLIGDPNPTSFFSFPFYWCGETKGHLLRTIHHVPLSRPFTICRWRGVLLLPRSSTDSHTYICWTNTTE